MARCSGSTPDGTPCGRIVGASQEYCYAHDPHHQKARSRAASKAARSKPSRELQDVKRQLQSLADGVRDGELDRADAAVGGAAPQRVASGPGGRTQVARAGRRGGTPERARGGT